MANRQQRQQVISEVQIHFPTKRKERSPFSIFGNWMFGSAISLINFVIADRLPDE